MPLLLPPSPSITSNKLKLSTLTFVTSNADKIREVTSICKRYGISVSVMGIDLPELQGSIEEVAREKCRQAALAVNGPVLIEDSALIFHALNGLPGPYIKWFYHSLGLQGLNRILADHEDKSAAAVCTFAFSWGPRPAPTNEDSDSDGGDGSSSEPEVFLFQARNEGKVVPERGDFGFAYDPIFEYEGKTYSELQPEVKNQVSDRSKALTKFIDWLAS
ncbi:nucleoside-triphosphatase, putative [Talaromyces stipitatus ATCC 10500]|uniref:Nucleoside-triphosphatase, putative n=1 Tax=Talaromyces stipitatus (strain ATCC 10500 / CBS 375.48 / QM 6759 / NRRL 1006) TaxID=441959 RepID=B8M2P7_TALSN|nr:nucleoside-triphosphatase, putative [Talaromyces stipitatus ATCC 10500]EED21958.1 nucleoside-triphosphatase, putative [Talaromyces stipitatus ATCC 10500]